MKEKLTYFSCIRFLKKYIDRYKKNFIMFYLGRVFELFLNFLLPVVFGIMIDEVVYYHNFNTFLQLSFFLIGCCLLSCVLFFLCYSQHGYLLNMFYFEIKKDIFEHLKECNAKLFIKSKHQEKILLYCRIIRKSVCIL